MIKAVIVDDEVHAQQSLKMLLDRFVSEVEIIGIADSVASAETLVLDKKPELIFLDVEMADGTGFDLLKRLSPVKARVIFVTGHNHYAIKAIKFAAFDYLNKPVDMDELRETVDRYSEIPGVKQIDLLNGNLQDGKLALPTMDGVDMIPHKDILYLKADGAWTDLILTTGQKLVASKRLGEIEKLLPAALFYRVHRSNVVNWTMVKKYIRGRGGYVVMENGDHINVSESNKRGLMKLLGLI